jgi:DNA-binding MarR family transcriptional regulator
MRNRDLKDEDFRLWSMIVTVRRSLYRAWAQEIKKLGISPPEAAALYFIEALKSEATPAELTRWLYREPNTTSTLLIRMEKKGLISRNNDLERKNWIRVALTSKGRDIYNSVIKSKTFDRILSCLSKEERSQFEFLLHRLYKKSIEVTKAEPLVRYPFKPL